MLVTNVTIKYTNGKEESFNRHLSYNRKELRKFMRGMFKCRGVKEVIIVDNTTGEVISNLNYHEVYYSHETFEG